MFIIRQIVWWFQPFLVMFNRFQSGDVHGQHGQHGQVGALRVVVFLEEAGEDEWASAEMVVSLLVFGTLVSCWLYRDCLYFGGFLVTNNDLLLP